jgi:hypothetical protein
MSCKFFHYSGTDYEPKSYCAVDGEKIVFDNLKKCCDYFRCDKYIDYVLKMVALKKYDELDKDEKLVSGVLDRLKRTEDDLIKEYMENARNFYKEKNKPVSL